MFQLLEPWLVGQFAIPAGTVLDGDDPQWNGIRLPFPFPLASVRCLTQEAYAAHVAAHSTILGDPDEFVHRLHYADGVVPKTKGQR